MTKQGFPKVHDIVRSKELMGAFVVVGVGVANGKCFIQEFDVSKQRFADDRQHLVESSTLLPFAEDASEAAFRIVKQATED